MSTVVRIEAARRFGVSVHDGFDYITDPVNWPEYWPRLVCVDAGTRWRKPGDRARLVLRMLGRDIGLEMTLVRIDPYRSVEYTSEQDGLPTARHWRHVDQLDRGFAYRIVVEYEPRPGWRSVVDRLLVRRATERAMRATIANLDLRLRPAAGGSSSPAGGRGPRRGPWRSR